MRTSDFDYYLPLELIAQTAVHPRDFARLMVVDRQAPDVRSGLEHTFFHQIIRYLDAGDVLVLNQTKVIPARIFARKKPSGGKVEILLLNKEADHSHNDGEIWSALLGGKKIRENQILEIKDGVNAQVIQVMENGKFRLLFESPITPVLQEIGSMPLPPYIRSYPDDPDDYQTVYARIPGSAAAPTAGLHFTNELLDKIKHSGVMIEKITLHVGLDTFLPVHEDDPTKHKIHTEWCSIPQKTVDVLRQAKDYGKKIVAVGTTSVRTLETLALINPIDPLARGYEGPTNLYILPGYRFHVVDSMITNFHLPKSTLLMMVCAFAGRERILEAYEIAKQERYRFYSFGDAMLIL